MKKELMDALYKKAVGYVADDTVEEIDAESNVVKRKVTYKHIPPDITAIKMYDEQMGGDKYGKLSDSELLKIKRRYLKELLEGERAGKQSGDADNGIGLGDAACGADITIESKEDKYEDC